MRIFYALNFTKDTKISLYNYVKLVKENSNKGNFTDINNLHLTLEFIGDVPPNELDKYTDILNSLTYYPEKLQTNIIGSFKKYNSEIVWIGLKKNDTLIKLKNNLQKKLENSGFICEKRPFKPHITVGRQVSLNKPLKDLYIEEITLNVTSVSLMESTRINNKLVYRPLFQNSN